VRRAGARLEGRVEWRDASDQWEGERTFSSRNETCAHIVRGMAFATATQIQLLAETGAAATATPATVGTAGATNATNSEGGAEATEAPPPAGAPSAPPEPRTPATKVERPPVPTPEPPAAVESAGPAAAPGAEGREPLIAVEAGIGVIDDAGDAPVMVAPRIAVTAGRPSGFGLRLAASGFGPSAQITRLEGTAQIDRYLVALQLIRFFRPGSLLQPFAAVGGGVQVVRARGVSATPALDHEANALSGLFAASGGLGIVLAARLSLIVEVEALLYRPEVTVQVGSSDAARLDGFGVFAHGGFLARF
jgi:hypothetical protein